MCVESQSQAAVARRGFRSLKELSQDFQQRQMVSTDALDAAVDASPAVHHDAWMQGSRYATLVKLFEGKGFGFLAPDDKSGDVFLHFKDIMNSSPEDMVVGMRVSFRPDVDSRSGKKRAKDALIIGMAAPGTVRSCLQSSQSGDGLHHGPETDVIGKSCAENGASVEARTAKPTDPHACYSRAELLAAFSAFHAAGDCVTLTGSGIRTIYMPRTKAKVGKASDVNLYEQDPNLDDEKCLVKLEARLSRESGADAKNNETFGDCEGGWTFDDAVEANARIALSDFSPKFDLDTSTAASDGASSEHGSHTGDTAELRSEPLSPLSFMLNYPMFAQAH